MISTSSVYATATPVSAATNFHCSPLVQVPLIGRVCSHQYWRGQVLKQPTARKWRFICYTQPQHCLACQGTAHCALHTLTWMTFYIWFLTFDNGLMDQWTNGPMDRWYTCDTMSVTWQSFKTSLASRPASLLDWNKISPEKSKTNLLGNIPVDFKPE